MGNFCFPLCADSYNDFGCIYLSFMGNPLLCGNWLGSVCEPYVLKSRGSDPSHCVILLGLLLVHLL